MDEKRECRLAAILARGLTRVRKSAEPPGQRDQSRDDGSDPTDQETPADHPALDQPTGTTNDGDCT